MILPAMRRHVARRRVVPGLAQAGDVPELRVLQAPGLGLAVHHRDEAVERAADGLGQRHRGVVAALHDHALEQVVHLGRHRRVDEHQRAAALALGPGALRHRQRLLAGSASCRGWRRTPGRPSSAWSARPGRPGASASRSASTWLAVQVEQHVVAAPRSRAAAVSARGSHSAGGSSQANCKESFPSECFRLQCRSARRRERCQARTTRDLQQRQLPMEEVAGAGNHGHRQAPAGAPSRRRPPAAPRRRPRRGSPACARHSGGTAATSKRLAAGPTSTRRSARLARRPQPLRAALARDVGAEGKAGQHQRPVRARGCGDHGQRVVDLARGLRRHALATPDTAEIEAHRACSRSCTKARASVCTTLLSIVPPCCGCGWHNTATPRGAHPAGRVDRRLDAARWAGDASGVAVLRVHAQPQRPTSGGSSRRSTTSPVLQVRLDDLVDVAAGPRRCTRRLPGRPRPPGRRRSGPGSRPC